MPQPNFVPVMPRISRRTQSSGMSAGASNDFCSPLIVRVMAIGRLQVSDHQSARRGEARQGLIEVAGGLCRAAIRQETVHIIAMPACTGPGHHTVLIEIRDSVSRFNLPWGRSQV